MNIELLPPDADVVAEVRDLVNRAYREAEDELWRGDAERIDSERVAEAIRAGRIAVARIDGSIAGCIRIRQLDDETGEFGLLAADPDRRGIGIGRELVRFAEALARERGLSRMRLKLLVPKEQEHAGKTVLEAWYTRLGYRLVGGEEHESPSLLVPCELRIYEKTL